MPVYYSLFWDASLVCPPFALYHCLMKSSELSLAVHSSGSWPFAEASAAPLVGCGVAAFLALFIIYLEALDRERADFYITTDSFL